MNDSTTKLRNKNETIKVFIETEEFVQIRYSSVIQTKTLELLLYKVKVENTRKALVSQSLSQTTTN